MSIQLCEKCQGERRNKCVIIEYLERIQALNEAAQADFVVTPGPQGGNKELAALFQVNTNVDFASLPAEADRRGCTVFSA